MTEPEIKKGLAGVVADYTAVSKVNPETNSLLYRGYPVQELAAHVQLRGGRLPALERRAARPTTQLAEFDGARARAAAHWTGTSSTSIDALPLDGAPDGRRAAPRSRVIGRPATRWPRTPRREAELAKAMRPVRRSCPPSSPTTSAAAAARSSSSRATTSDYSRELPVDDLRRGGRPRGRATRSTSR